MALADDNRLDEASFHVSEATAGDFVALLKPRVMSLVVFTAFVGMVAAPATMNPVLAIIAIVAIAVGAGASGALNMWYDADIDQRMARTASRPVATGRVRPGEALVFGIVLSAFSVVTLGLTVNWLSASLLAFTIFFYAVIYTMWLKRRTPQNIVIGGAAGALPPVIGWAAATGSVSVEPLVLFLIIFLWTPPHFWALAMLKADEYGRAGVPMLPNVAGMSATRRQIFVYTLLVALAGVLPWLLGHAGTAYGLCAALLGAGFVRSAWRVARAGDDDHRAARSLFAYSLLYLFAIFALLLVDAVLARIAA